MKLGIEDFGPSDWLENNLWLEGCVSDTGEEHMVPLVDPASKYSIPYWQFSWANGRAMAGLNTKLFCWKPEESLGFIFIIQILYWVSNCLLFICWWGAFCDDKDSILGRWNRDFYTFRKIVPSNYNARNLCLSVFTLFMMRTVNPIDFTLDEFVAEDRKEGKERKCAVKLVVWLG